MKWPFVSRGAYDALAADRDAWREAFRTVLDLMGQRTAQVVAQTPAELLEPPDPKARKVFGRRKE